jgi:dTMP kinase
LALRSRHRKNSATCSLVIFIKGIFITFEGGEGAGKTTQIARVATALREQGRDVLTTREPGGNENAEKIRTLLLNSEGASWQPLTELFLISAARHEHVAKTIFPALTAGKVVLCDRFTDSTLAYQGYAGGLPRSIIDELNTLATLELQPHATLFFDVPPSVGLQRSARRGGTDHFEEKDRAFHGKLYAGFKEMVQNNPKRFTVIDATQPLERVTEQCLAAVEKILITD